MASRFASKTSLLKSSPVSQILKRSYASEHGSAKHATESFPEERFSSNVWRNSLLTIIAGVVFYRVSEHVTGQGEEKHPFTKWIEYRMTPSTEMDRINTENLEAAEKLAEYRLVYQDAQRAPIYRMRYPESFERASARGLTAGSHADLTDLKIRSD
ncbi:hypothetical protein J3Q64DRAFT_1829291 [Phycomyces blakesleeanus]|uniref:Uncharacterized protein n=2 Tax=Phycomyces blakesleeanus TaxID=4837 RepID=A0ABR3BIC8_PHYBL